MELLFEKRIERIDGRLITLKGHLRRLLKMLEAQELDQARGDGLKVRFFFYDAAGIAQEYEVLLKNFHVDCNHSWKRTYRFTGRGWQRLVTDQRLKAGDFVRLWASRAPSFSDCRGGGDDRDGEGAGSLVVLMTVESREGQRVGHHGRREQQGRVVDRLAEDLARRLRVPDEEAAPFEEQLMAARFSQMSIPGDSAALHAVEPDEISAVFPASKWLSDPQTLRTPNPIQVEKGAVTVLSFALEV